MKIDIEKVHEIINRVDNAVNEADHSEDWNKGFDEAIAQIRYGVLEIEKTHVEEEA